MNKKYYAVQFLSGYNTTMGTPNEKTGKLSIACNLFAFSSKESRNLYVSEGVITSDMQGNCRKAVTKKEVRNLHLGMSVDSFNQYLDMQVVY